MQNNMGTNTKKSSVMISVIVPVYNIENYLRKSIDSILNQTFVDFELFLVDDGSSDSTGDICDEYETKDNRIKVIHQKNSGAFAARNVAIDMAIGKYVCFFDGDDYVDENMLYDLYNLAEEYSANLVVSGFYIETYYDDINFVTLNYIPRAEHNIEFYKNKNDFRKNAYMNFDINMFYPPWNKMYSLKYLKDNNIKFPNTYRDDFPFVVDVIKDIDRVVFTKKQYYHFIRKRADSETQKYVEKLYDKREEEHKNMISLYRYWNLIDDKNSREMIARRYIDRVIECTTNLYNKQCTYTKIEKKQIIKKYLDNENLAISLKFAKPKKLYSKIMYIPIRLRSVNLTMLMSRFINFVKSRNIKLFSILKKNR